MIYVAYLHLIHQGLQVLPKIEIKGEEEIWGSCRPQDHADEFKHPETADPNTDAHAFSYVWKLMTHPVDPRY